MFREFRFDFTTPGARANAMGRAFVGLSDEATAAYNNPAGLAVLNAPEFSVEFRQNDNTFQSLAERGYFTLSSFNTDADQLGVDSSRLKDLTFASFSISRGNVNLNAFYTNQLNYQRSRSIETSLWEFESPDNYYTFNYDNRFDVEKIRLDTFGFSLSRRWGHMSWGVSLAISKLDLDYIYRTSLSSDDILLDDQVRSSADHTTAKLAYVLGWQYQVHPKVKLALSAKRLPKFTYPEVFRNNQILQEQGEDAEVEASVQFKIPDSYQIGMAFQPNDFWTVVAEVNWIQYQQLSGDNLTILSTIDIGRPDFFQFSQSDFENANDPSLHLGLEYLWPRGRDIYAFRCGAFHEADHKTRFVGRPNDDEENLRELFDIQDFIYNTGDNEESMGFTLGIGYVRNNRIQVDVAYVESDDFKSWVTSMLYRF
ncbi:OmpP1/FadL family transporter [Sulfidibacter corallicola]|uniref:Long-chain fatty acid transport protein n=1 Tax=Sulfidibacter corallicola TaxID=2818388 RepID=A0A8A4TFD0_SULCO|nr:hypothetical protein [Sulfidibacter corallicola]QTD47912.1 hypothetical protein J3U87_20190 [Sulfidibacter corallicola]